MNGESLLQAFQAELEKNGFSDRIVWLHHDQMHLTKNTLYVYPTNGFPSDNQVIAAYDKQSPKFEFGATVMLVAVSDQESYCTLLMDSFGSDTEVEIEENIYLWANEPYVQYVEFVTGRFQWFLCKRKPPVLSSLDYAFGIEQAYT
ncbi:MAG: hypothetical protein CMG81_05510 [Marinobacter sp.]|nr:hypothetical protein [Marinobacter sp.]|tara:strand:+ start:347 stop:784 length:438 start_codon:yes stop_codon:yes gene_type:complete